MAVIATVSVGAATVGSPTGFIDFTVSVIGPSLVSAITDVASLAM